jgi:hypothetical protein
MIALATEFPSLATWKAIANEVSHYTYQQPLLSVDPSEATGNQQDSLICVKEL